MKILRPTVLRGTMFAVLTAAMAATYACSGDQETPEEAVDKGSGSGSEAAAAPEEEKTAAEPEEAPPAAAPAPAPAPTPAPAPAPAEPSGFDGQKVTRYVTSFALKVRSAPSKEAPVVRHVKWGDKLEVVINGEWAKLAPGQYISNNRLSETMPTKSAGKGKKKTKK